MTSMTSQPTEECLQGEGTAGSQVHLEAGNNVAWWNNSKLGVVG